MKTPVQFGALLCLAIGMTSGCALLDLDRPAMVQGRSPLRPAKASPDSVAVEIVWARFPAGDPSLNETIWQDIDETPIEPAVARELARNGFRAGVISGELPPSLASALHQDESPPEASTAKNGDSLEELMVEPTVRARLVQARRGRRVEIQASDVYNTLPLLKDEGGELGGTTYRSAQAMYALEVDPQPDRMAAVQLTPELHHGSPHLCWSRSDEGILRQAPMRDHEVFDRLRLRVKLAPGEMLVLMNLPGAGSRLGQYFHTVDSVDGRQQKLILVRLAEVPQSDTFADVGHL
ncbi:MAG: hypothetical protein WD468_07310 [Pirellulales bacterium]